MYLSIDQIRIAISQLEPFHPFFGVSFLVAKKANLPVGSTISFAFDTAEREFLQLYYKPFAESSYFYRVFKPSDKKRQWLSGEYSRTSSQSSRTRGDIARAFIHEKKKNLWGWSPDYVDILAGHLSSSKRGEKIPLFSLASWIYRDQDWPVSTTPDDIVHTFRNDFAITEHEKNRLFDVSMDIHLEGTDFLVESPPSRQELRNVLGAPEDLAPEEGGTLAYLEIKGVGPAEVLAFRPADRLSLLTGDNGLGKTFLLECAWWALTGEWAGPQPFATRRQRRGEPNISFQIAGETTTSAKATIEYDWNTQSWPSPRNRPTIPGLIVYARVDGSFAVWDPEQKPLLGHRALRSLVFRRDDVWDGLEEETAWGQRRSRINGLLRDWIKWQDTQDKSPFHTFTNVLRRLSPVDLGPLEPGEPVRLPYDTKDIPTIRYPYGDVPIVHAAAGVRRIVTMAYLLVWAWEEHKVNSRLANKPPQRRMVVLIDEIEAHLHPQWQRRILPALLSVREDLSTDLQVQFLVATHAPLVMASAEPFFDPSQDKMFHLELVRTDLFGSHVRLDEIEFYKHGPADAWLTSEIFDLRQARSVEAEEAILKAKALQEQTSPDPAEIKRVSLELIKYLAADDEFWPRWKFFELRHTKGA